MGYSWMNQFGSGTPALTTASADELQKRTLRVATPSLQSESTTPAKPPAITSSGGISTNTTRSQACIGAPYQKPSALSTPSLPLGVTIQRDTTQTYEVYGNTLTQLRRSIDACGARISSAGIYHALTGYNITWQYTPTQNANGTCSLVNVKIASHISQYLPSSTTSLSSWRTYLQALQTHEDGHVDINIRHVQSLQAKLVALQNVDCVTLSATANQTIQTELALLASANELYDATTNHGATQGALL